MLPLDTEGKVTEAFFLQSLPGWLMLRQPTSHNTSDSRPVGFLKVL